MLSNFGIQRCALPRYQTEKINILDIVFPRVGIKTTAGRAYSRVCALRKGSVLMGSECLSIGFLGSAYLAMCMQQRKAIKK